MSITQEGRKGNDLLCLFNTFTYIQKRRDEEHAPDLSVPPLKVDLLPVWKTYRREIEGVIISCAERSENIIPAF